MKSIYPEKEKTPNSKKTWAIYGIKSSTNTWPMMIVSVQNSSTNLSICSKRESHTNWEAPSGQWFTKISWESHGNFTCNFCNAVKRVGLRNQLRFKFKKTSTVHSQEKESNLRTKINLLIKFSKFWSCSIYTDRMSVTFREWHIQRLF